jgi:hypothetical protein
LLHNAAADNALSYFALSSALKPSQRRRAVCALLLAVPDEPACSWAKANSCDEPIVTDNVWPIRNSAKPDRHCLADGPRFQREGTRSAPLLRRPLGVTATVTLITTHRDDPPATQAAAVAPPDQSKACGPVDDDTIRAGWGPDRPTVTGQQFTATAQMNSDRGNPHYGDERSLIAAKDAANTAAGGWKNEVNVEDGATYLIRMYVHNSADSAPDHTAHDVRLSANVPNCTAHKIRIDGYITAADTFPTTVYATVVFQSDRLFNLTYKPGSARYYSNPHPNGIALTDDIVIKKGTPVGVEQMDGVVPGNYANSGYAVFEVTAAFPE